MRVLVACECSGEVRDAFIALGHDAVSCDLLPTERPGPHIQGDVLELLDPVYGWDMLIGFPPCTHVCSSGARWFKFKQREQAEAIEFFKKLWNAPVPRVALENPVGVLSSKFAKPTQIIHPWQHGHGETKTTCIWSRGLPLLKPTHIVAGREPRIHRMAPGPDRARERSRTYRGIARAMAQQWGGPA